MINGFTAFVETARSCGLRAKTFPRNSDQGIPRQKNGIVLPRGTLDKSDPAFHHGLAHLSFFRRERHEKRLSSNHRALQVFAHIIAKQLEQNGVLFLLVFFQLALLHAQLFATAGGTVESDWRRGRSSGSRELAKIP